MDKSSRRQVNSDDLHTIIATSMDGFLLIDMGGNILEVNESYCQLVGHTREQLLSMHVSSVDAVDNRADVAKRMEKIAQMGSLRFETKYRHKNGTIIDIEASSNYSHSHGGSIFSFVRDISYQKRNQQIIAARLRLIEYSHYHSLQELLRETLDEAEMLTGSCIGFYHFMDSDTQLLTLQAWSTRTAAEFCKAEGAGSHYPIAQAGVWVDCVHERRPVIHNDYISLPHRKGMPEGHASVVRELVVPIFREDNIVAILGVGNKYTDYDQQDIEVITILADLAWEVAERKKAEETLKKSEAILNSSQHLAKVGGWKWDVVNQSMTWTEETYRIHDFKPGSIKHGSSEHIEKSLNCYDPEDRQTVFDTFQRCVKFGVEYDLELPFTTAAGRRLWVRTTAKPVWYEERVEKVIGNIMDITESKQMKEELARQVDFSTRVFNSSDANMAVVDCNGIIQGFNEAWRRFAQENMGIDESRWNVGASYFVKYDAKWGDAEQAEEAFEGIRKVQRLELPHFSLEYPCHGSGNVQRWFHMKVLPLLGSEGSVLVSHTNITERKCMELALCESEEQFSSSFHYAPIGIALVAPDGRWLKVNQALCDIIGYTEEELLDLTFQDITHPDDLETDLAQVQQMLDGIINTYQMEKRYYHKNGTTVWVLLSVSLVRGREMKPRHFLSQIIDITDRKRAENAIQKAHEQLEQMTAAVPGVVYQFMYTATGEWKFIHVSNGLKDLYEIDPEAALKDHNVVTSCIVPEDQGSHRESVENASRSLSLWVHEHRIITPSGKFKWVRGQAIPLLNGDGSVLWNGILIDVTDRKQMEEDLFQAKAVAESANRAKSEFLANMSHEIRTPMNGLLGLTQLLELSELTKEQLKYTDSLKRCAKNLMDLINDILDLSKIEAGKVDIILAELSLKQCINDIVLMQKFVSQEKGLKLEIDISDDIPHLLIADQLRIKQILHNLIGNAVKFTVQGSVTVSAHLLERHETSVLVRMAVRDTGVGISPESFDHIFNAFTQEDGSVSRRFGGTGLGLTISRKLAELMGGTITVESSLGVGSCFAVTLPLIISTTTVITQATAAPTSTWDGQPLRILLVDDDEVNTTFGAALLKKLGHTVTTAENGSQCLATLENDLFDIVLMDVQMPVMNGEETLREIRTKEIGTATHLPIIALTAHSMRGDRERLLEVGFDGYVSKPLYIDDLALEMKRVKEKFHE